MRHDHSLEFARFGKPEDALKAELQRTFKPVRANETSGPAPEGPTRRCGGACGEVAMPGVMNGREPKYSVWMRPAAIPTMQSRSGADPNRRPRSLSALLKVEKRQIVSGVFSQYLHHHEPAVAHASYRSVDNLSFRDLP